MLKFPKKFIQKNTKKKIAFSILIGLVLSALSVYAETTLKSSDFEYDNSNSSLSSANVESAISELASKSEKACPQNYKCYKTYPHIGDYVKMTPTATSYTVTTDKTGYSSNQTINPSELNLWRVLSVDSTDLVTDFNGNPKNPTTITIISEYTSSNKIYFNGKKGYENFVGILNSLSSAYGNNKYTVGYRNVGYSNQTEFITLPSLANSSDNPSESEGGGDTEYDKDIKLINKVFGTTNAYNVSTKKTSPYWLSSRSFEYTSTRIHKGSYVNGNAIETSPLYILSSNGEEAKSIGYTIRPILVLREGIDYIPASGTKYDPFILK